MILSEDGIRERHDIPVLWGAEENGAVKKSWTEAVSFRPGPLAPKSYQKTYTLTGIETRDGQKVAVVDMKAMESAEPVEGQKQSSASMGFMAKMFDSQDVYTGKLLLGVDNGDVIEYDETLVSTMLLRKCRKTPPLIKGRTRADYAVYQSCLNEETVTVSTGPLIAGKDLGVRKSIILLITAVICLGVWGGAERPFSKRNCWSLTLSRISHCVTG